jgi:hypothetical protein
VDGWLYSNSLLNLKAKFVTLMLNVSSSSIPFRNSVITKNMQTLKIVDFVINVFARQAQLFESSLEEVHPIFHAIDSHSISPK